jgi:long-chain acyl-CoA synthetase
MRALKWRRKVGCKTMQTVAGVLRGETFVALEQLEERARKAATGLAAAGVEPGDVVALLLRNDHAFFEATWAAGLIGAEPVPINWHGSRDEVSYILADSGAKILVCHSDLLHLVDPDFYGRNVVLVVPTPPDVAAAYLGIRSGREDSHLRWYRWLAEFPAHPGDIGSRPISMIYTSGTTGRPKGVRRVRVSDDQTAAPNSSAELLAARGLASAMRTIISAPMYHNAPNLYALTAARMGGTLVLQPRFDAAELLRLVAEHAATHLYLVPTMFRRLLRLSTDARAQYDVSCLQTVVHAGAPCPAVVKEQMIAWWGPIINEYYGCTESGAVVACTSTEWLAHRGTVGRPVGGASVVIYGDDMRPLPTGSVGDVYVRSPAYPDFTYHGMPDARRDVEHGGLITCGDVGYLDDDGFLYLCDRRRDMIISGGVNIYPAEIEACLLGMAGVHDCAVFGIPDEEFGEAVAVAVELEPGAVVSDAGIRDYLRRHLASFKVPKVVEFHESLPREDSGKIFKRRLRESYWRDSGRLI